MSTDEFEFEYQATDVLGNVRDYATELQQHERHLRSQIESGQPKEVVERTKALIVQVRQLRDADVQDTAKQYERALRDVAAERQQKALVDKAGNAIDAQQQDHPADTNDPDTVIAVTEAILKSDAPAPPARK